MQVKEIIKVLAQRNMDEEICFWYQDRPDDIDVYTWAWITDNFSLKMLHEWNDIFSNAIYALKAQCPFIPKVASGDVVFIERTDIAQG